MTASDVSRPASAGPGERLAPVTYMFGTPTEGLDLASEGSAPISASHPVFRDEPALMGLRGAAVAISTTESEAAQSEAGQARARQTRAGQTQAQQTRAQQTRAEQTQAQQTEAAAEANGSVAKSERGRFDRVSNVSMYALARRGMSSREMRDYLLGREFEEAVVDDEVTRLEGVGLLDDDSLAETLVRTLRDRKGLGRSAVTAELRRRHVSGDAIEEALGNLDDDELERATEIAVKRAPQLRSLDSVTAKRRLGAFLMRKGYSGSVISTAVQRALAPSGPSFR